MERTTGCGLKDRVNEGLGGIVGEAVCSDANETSTGIGLGNESKGETNSLAVAENRFTSAGADKGSPGKNTLDDEDDMERM
jgi:hypothetical protein